jgi:TRAP-type C4-dicarboxylate transport system permease small subunit
MRFPSRGITSERPGRAGAGDHKGGRRPTPLGRWVGLPWARAAGGFALRFRPPVSDSVYKRIDHAVYRAERAMVVGSLLVMSVVVFLDVVHRSFSGDESKLAMVVAKVAGWVGVAIPPGSPGHQQLTAASPYVLFVGFSALAYFGIRSTKRATPIAAPIAAAGAVAGVLVSYGLVRLLLVLLPNGLIWSQDLALVLTLWVGFVGASMCTYENRHLRVEAVQRFLPEKLRSFVGFTSGLFTTLVCVGLLWLSVRYVGFHWQEYASTHGQGGVFPGMELPKYVGFAALPLAFGFMTVRFFVKAVAALRGEVEAPLDPLVAVGVARVDSARMPPSNVATEALPQARDDVDEEEESAIETMTSKIERRVPDAVVRRPQSKVPTDAHGILPPLPLADDDSLDPDRTKELEEGPIPFSEDTLDPDSRVAALPSVIVAGEEQGR